MGSVRASNSSCANETPTPLRVLPLSGAPLASPPGLVRHSSSLPVCECVYTQKFIGTEVTTRYWFQSIWPQSAARVAGGERRRDGRFASTWWAWCCVFFINTRNPDPNLTFSGLDLPEDLSNRCFNFLGFNLTNSRIYPWWPLCGEYKWPCVLSPCCPCRPEETLRHGAAGRWGWLITRWDSASPMCLTKRYQVGTTPVKTPYLLSFTHSMTDKRIQRWTAVYLGLLYKPRTPAAVSRLYSSVQVWVPSLTTSRSESDFIASLPSVT